MKPACHHLGLFVHDLERMTRFYVQRLGFSLDRDYTVEKEMMQKIFALNSACRIRYLNLRGFGMELFCFYEIKLNRLQPKQPGLNHWTLLVEDKDKFCRDLEKKRIKIIKIPKPHGFTYFIRDPEGNLIEVKSHELKDNTKTRY